MKKNKWNQLVDTVGLPCIIIFGFFFLLLIVASFQGMNMLVLLGDILKRWGMNGVLVLAMVPGIQAGIGLNFGVSLGIVSGLLGTVVAVEFKLIQNPAFTPFTAGLASILIAIIVGSLVASLLGWVYGTLLNKVKGSEMTISTYVGFSAIAFMNMMWLLLPFKNGDAIWPVGGIGLRNTINLEGYFASFLNNMLGVHLGGQRLVEGTETYTKNIIHFGNETVMIGTDRLIKNSLYIPTGLLLFFFLACFCVWLFLRTKPGTAMAAAGSNPSYAKSSGINSDKTRILGTMLSTVLGAIGIIVYSQSYGFIQLYNAPLMMGFFCAASVLIGGATVKKASILNVLVGTFLFQGVLAVALPVANELLPGSNIADIVRIVISNGIILYAITKTGGAKASE